MNSMTHELIQQIADALRSQQLKLATAESCTGGWIAKCCTDLAGSSDWFELSVVSYSNRAKMQLLGVTEQTLDDYGAVSEQVVRQMVQGVLRRSDADVALSVSGIAGPGGGSDDKPVGTVWFAWCQRGAEPVARVMHFDGDRDQVRSQSVEYALRGLLALFDS